MVKTYAIVENGKVVNITIASKPLAANWIQSDTAAIGDFYDGEVFTRPPAVVIPPDFTETVQNSYKSRLKGRAQTLSKRGDFFQAAKLLIKAESV